MNIRESNKELDCGEDILNNEEGDAMKNVCEINREIHEILTKKQGKLVAEKEVYHEDYYFLSQFKLFNKNYQISLSFYSLDAVLATFGKLPFQVSAVDNGASNAKRSFPNAVNSPANVAGLW